MNIIKSWRKIHLIWLFQIEMKIFFFFLPTSFVLYYDCLKERERRKRNKSDEEQMMKIYRKDVADN